MLMAILGLFCSVQAFLAALVSWLRVRLVDHQVGILIQRLGCAPATKRSRAELRLLLSDFHAETRLHFSC